MSDLKARFDSAAEEVQALPVRPDNASLLKLYALFKQATTGDVSGEAPGFFDMIGRAKYDAWAELAGTASDAAMQEYVELVDRLKG